MFKLIRKIFTAIRDAIRDYRNEIWWKKKWKTRRCIVCKKDFTKDTHIYVGLGGDHHRECWYGETRLAKRILAEDVEFSDRHTE